MQCRSRL